MNGYCELITGTLGGGKTLLAVEGSYQHACRGGHVYSNIQFKGEEWARTMRDRDGLRFDPSRVVTLGAAETLEFHKHVPRGTHSRCVRVIIDEAGLEFNSRKHASLDDELLALATLARKLDIALYFVSQQSTDIFKQFRGKCRCEWQCRNMFHRRIFGVVPLKVPLFFRVCYDTTKGKREYITHDVVVSPTWVYSLYDSDSLVGRGFEAVSSMQQVSAEPLERIERPAVVGQIPPRVLAWGSVLCGFGFGLSSF